jgi:hypothetical protein
VVDDIHGSPKVCLAPFLSLGFKKLGKSLDLTISRVSGFEDFGVRVLDFINSPLPLLLHANRNPRCMSLGLAITNQA